MQFTLPLWSVISGMKVTSLVWALQALVSIAIWCGISRYILQWSNLSHYLHVIIDTVRKALPQMEQFPKKSNLCLSKPENWRKLLWCHSVLTIDLNMVRLIFIKKTLTLSLQSLRSSTWKGGKLRAKSKLKPTPAKLQHLEIQKRETWKLI